MDDEIDAVFVKLIETDEYGQIVAIRDTDTGQPAIKFFVRPKGWGTCQAVMRWRDNSEESFMQRDEYFFDLDEEEAKKQVYPVFEATGVSHEIKAS